MLCLVVKGDRRVGRYPFKDGRLRIGSDPDNDVVLANRFVSRHHAVLRVVDGEVEVEDLGSRNGTHLDGRRITSARGRPPFTLMLGTDTIAWVRSVPSEEIDLGLATSSRAGVIADAGAPRRAHSTDPGNDTEAGFAFELLGALAGSSPALAGPRLVEIVARALNAPAACLVLARPSGAPTVLHDVGLEAAALLERSLPAALEGARRRGETASSADAAIAHVAAPCGDDWLVLVVQARPTTQQLAAARSALQLVAWIRGGRAPTAPPSASRTFDLSSVPGAVATSSPLMAALHERMASALASRLPVLLLGSTGVGKEVYARAIHQQSSRAAGPLRTINSSALPAELQESLLFGVEESVATGVRRGPGLLRDADGGTFFLDEIGEMPLQLQAKLLRVLDSGEVLAVGSLRPVKVDVRIVAATHRDLDAEVAAGRFRLDLLHRLRGHVFRIPDLREHPEDIPLYVAAFLDDECARSGRHVPGVTRKALDLLRRWHWPGNVRELEQLVRRLVHEIPHGQPIGHHDLPPAFATEEPRPSATLEDRLDPERRRLILEALRDTGWNRRDVARRLGMSRTRLRLLMRRLGVDGENGV